MVIQIDGTGMQNKGAELMLNAILGEIEIRYPDSIVIYNTCQGDTSLIDTNLKISHRFFLKYGRYPAALLRRLNLDCVYLTSFYVNSKVDILLDGSGFKWGDHWSYSEDFYRIHCRYYEKLKKNGTKIIFLPQAFGPFQNYQSNSIIEILNNFVDLIFAREIVSFNYLIEAGVNKEKVLLSTDFTSTVKPVIFENLIDENSVCIIINFQIIKHNISFEKYVNFVRGMIFKIKSLGFTPFLLNHEGQRDFNICNHIIQDLGFSIKLISGLNAKQTKGVIFKSYAVISSRYHGVASALNQGVPCLATSWSHKYAELFSDFGLKDKLIDIDSSQNLIESQIEELLDVHNNTKVVKTLQEANSIIKQQINAMWDIVFDSI